MHAQKWSIALNFLTIVLLFTVRASAAVVWDESVNGDLSNDYLNPTRLTLATGVNSVIASVSNESVPQDLDYFRIDIPAGRKLTAFLLQSYVSFDQTAFIGMQSGPNFTFPAGEANDHFDEILGYAHFGPGQGDDPPTNIDLLPRMGLNGPIGFVPPLAGPTYTFWVQQLGSTTAYQFDLVISPLVKGDFDLNGSLDAGDLPAMLAALCDLPKFEADNNISPTDLADLGDFTGDSSVTNVDLQGLIHLLASGNLQANGDGAGPLLAVPEPASWTLCAICALALPLVLGGLGSRNRATPCLVPKLLEPRVS